jgi:WD40 repeat protein
MASQKLVRGLMVPLSLLAVAALIVFWRPAHEPPLPADGAGRVDAGSQLLGQHRHWVHAVAFAPDGQTVASAGGGVGPQGGELRLWDVAGGRELAAITVESAAVQRVAFSPDNQLLAAIKDDGSVLLCETATGTVRTVPGREDPTACAVAFSPDGRTLFSWGLVPENSRAWDVGTLAEQATFPAAFPCALSSDGRALAANMGNLRGVQIWNLEIGYVRATLADQSQNVTCVAWSPDSKLVATCGFCPEVHLWDGLTFLQRAVLVGHDGAVRCVAFSPDGRTVATAGQDRTIRLWDVPSGRRRATLAGHTGPVESIAFAPDGKRLASGSYDRTVRLWDLSAASGSRNVSPGRGPD